MAKSEAKKGSRLVCVPCGREVIVDCCGISTETIWCCGKPMEEKKHSAAAATNKKSNQR